MKKILVLFTGGTIGSHTDNGIINVESDEKFTLTDEYKKLFGNANDFECRQILNVLSENMGLDYWNVIISEISKINTADYSGIILTHGSDTLAYTSALIGMYFRHIDIPFYIIAGNKPINESGSNSMFNFSSAVKLINEGKYKGVFTLYEKVMLPTRIIPADSYCDRFGIYGDNGIKEESIFRGAGKKQLFKAREKLFDEEITLKNQILMLHGYPSINFDSINLDTKPSAVLYVPYHSGTGCTEGESTSLCEFIKKCIVRDIMVYICGIKDTKVMYSTLKDIINAGSIPLSRICFTAAYMKLLIVYNQNVYPVKELMEKNLYFEILPPKI